MRANRWNRRLGGLLILAGALFAQTACATATLSDSPVRIVVLPFYTEEGTDAKDAGYEARHYRRIAKFINNQLARHGFEVINPFAAELREEEYNSYRKRSREDSPLAAREMTRKYATDVAYIVWLDVKKRLTGDGYCKAQARVEGEGYDSGARDLGVGLIKTFKVTRRNCEDAIVEAEKEVGDIVGRTLTAWRGSADARRVVSSGGVTAESGGGGAVQRAADALQNLVNVRLEGGTEYELVEVFGKVIHTVRGVVDARTYRVRVEPESAQASFALWRVRIEDTDPFRLQANVMKMLADISEASGRITLKGVPYRYDTVEIELLKGIRPGDATTREIVFVVDRERVRDLEFSRRDGDGYQRVGNSGYD